MRDEKYVCNTMKESLKHIILRDKLMKETRAFFTKRKFCEVIPPILNNAIPNEPNLYPFLTSWNRNGAEETRYLPTSPERALKIALSAGLGDCYAIGHCFRNLEGAGAFHSPEFLMLEWYRVNGSYQEIMKEIQEYIAFVNSQLLRFRAKSLEESLSVDQASLRPCPQCSRICEAGGGTAILRQAPRENRDRQDDKAVTKQSHQILELKKYPWQTCSLRERFEKLSGTSYERLVTDDKVLEGVAK